MKRLICSALACFVLAGYLQAMETPTVVELRHGNVRSVAFSPDGTKIATVATGSVLVEVLGENHRVVVGNIRIWNADSGEMIREWQGHIDAIESVAFSPDGKTIVTAGATDRTARIWDVETGEELRVFRGRGQDGIRLAVFTPDGKKVVAGTMGSNIQVWDIESSEVLQTMSGHSPHVNALAISPDGKKIVSGDHSHTRIWDVESGEELRRLGRVFSRPGATTPYIDSVAFSPCGKKTAAVGIRDRNAWIWDTDSGEELYTLHTPRIGFVVFSPDGKKLLTTCLDGPGVLHIWDAETGEELQRIENRSTGSAAFSPDGKRVVVPSGLITRILYLEAFPAFPPLHRPAIRDF